MAGCASGEADRFDASASAEAVADPGAAPGAKLPAMVTGSMIAEIAALAGDPARANILAALLDGRAMTASELAYAARVTPQTASAHLARLAEAALISVTPAGRHRYFRLASPLVAQMIESIGAVSIDGRPRFRPLSRQAAALRAARVCYDHLAGVLGVAIADAMIHRGYIVLEDEGGHLTTSGTQFIAGLGIDLFDPVLQRRKRHCRACLDWTERRPHIGGAIGAAIAERWLALGWIERAKDSRAVSVTPAGRTGFRETLGLAFGDDERAVA
ncbi:MAG TPA: winged helix-turn-helix domain-containing protein [Stellaceae bacterium]|nr:winged helix-turn-helix domain-containing protein [Stellaceae bacterium]